MRTPLGRALRAAFILLLLLALTPLRAPAGTLFAASLMIEIDSDIIAPVIFVGSSVSGSSAGALNVTLAAGSGFAGTYRDAVSTPVPLSYVNFTAGANAWGQFSGVTPSVVGGAMPMQVRFCAQSYSGLCLLDLQPPFGTSVTVMPPVVSGIGVTMHGSNWTAGTASLALTGGGTTTRMGSNGLNGKGAGTLVMVSSVNVLTSIAGQLPSFATLTLEFVPEPESGALVGLAGVALALGQHGLRRRRAARSSDCA